MPYAQPKQTVPEPEPTADYEWPEDLSVENSGGDFVLAEQDFYNFLRIDDIGPVQPVIEKFNPHGDKYQALFYLSVYNDERYEDGAAKIQQYFTLSLNEKANLYPVVKAALGGELDPKYKLKPSDLIGKFIRASVTHTKENDKGQVYAKIIPSSAAAIKGQAPTVAPF